MNALFSESGLKLGLRAEENRIEVLTEYGNFSFSHPYHLTSTHLQRLVFHVAALRSHVEDLAESIALDDRGNQYFLSTYSPHLLKSLLEKTSPGDIAVFMTNCYDYRTRVSQIPQHDLDVLTQGADLSSSFGTLLETA